VLTLLAAIVYPLANLVSMSPITGSIHGSSVAKRAPILASR